MATKLWDVAALKLDEMLWMGLLLDVVHPVDVVQNAAAKALAALLTEYEGPIPKVIENLLGIYKEKMAVSLVSYLFYCSISIFGLQNTLF